jgi:hybrid cluster-associated redox disulfide protein
MLHFRRGKAIIAHGESQSILEVDRRMISITKDTVIADILDMAPQSAPVFMSIGMHCLGCVMASGETLGEACEAHGVDADEFMARLISSLKQ